MDWAPTPSSHTLGKEASVLGENPGISFIGQPEGALGAKKLFSPSQAQPPPTFLTPADRGSFTHLVQVVIESLWGREVGGGVRAPDAPPRHISLHPRAPELRGRKASSHPNL